MTKRRVWYGILALLLLILVPTGIAAFGPPTRDDGLRWFNEEFWITLVINFVSVAASIGLTVLISYRLLQRQFAFERANLAQQRADDLADRDAAFARDNRMALSDDLDVVLSNTAGRIQMLSDNLGNTNVGYNPSFEVQDVESWLLTLVQHKYQRTGNEPMHTTIIDLERKTRRLISLMRDRGTVAAEYTERWRYCALNISNQYKTLESVLFDWRNTGELSLPANIRVEEVMDELEKESPVTGTAGPMA